MVVGLAIVLTVRPDPKRIAAALRERDGATATPTPPSAAEEPERPAAPLRVLLRRPGVIPALVAAQASFAVMVAVMTLTGAVVVDHHHHAADNVFPIIGAHVIGMFGLIIIVGDLVDRMGRTPALIDGLLLMAVSTISLLWITSVPASMVALFVLGLGWNLSFVAATAVLSDSTAPSERGKLLGFNDLLAGLTGAGLALLGRRRADGARRRLAGDRRRGARRRARRLDHARGAGAAPGPRPPEARSRSSACCPRLSSGPAPVSAPAMT